MSVFHFKRFDVLNEASSMKVNTDGVLLGAATDIAPNDRYILDVGTGTGTIALMLAQRYSDIPESALTPERHICGIDIDGPSALEAAFNFNASPWAKMLEARHCPLRQYFPEHELDLIVSNPPFFDDSLLSPLERRSVARHTGGPALSFASLVDFSCEVFSCILSVANSCCDLLLCSCSLLKLFSNLTSSCSWIKYEAAMQVPAYALDSNKHIKKEK